MKRILVGIICWILASCTGVRYTFNNSFVDPAIKTISIEYFQNLNGGGPPNLSQTFTEAIRDYYMSNTKLDLVQLGGDLQIKGNIVGYSLSPIAPVGEGNQQYAAQTRLTLSVKVDFVNNMNEEKSFEDKMFSQFADFETSKSLSSVENSLIEEINTKLLQDIFTATVGGW